MILLGNAGAFSFTGALHHYHVAALAQPGLSQASTLTKYIGSGVVTNDYATGLLEFEASIYLGRLSRARDQRAKSAPDQLLRL